jgi:hypothetical protein
MLKIITITRNYLNIDMLRIFILPLPGGDDYMDVVGRAAHDCMDAGGRVKQESEPRKPKPRVGVRGTEFFLKQCLVYSSS